MTDLAVREEAWAYADSLYRRWFHSRGWLGETDAPLHERAIHAYVRRDTASLGRMVEEAVRTPSRRPGLGGRALVRYFADRPLGLRLAAAGTAAGNTPAIRAFHHQVLAELALAGGARREASRQLREAEILDPGLRFLRAYWATLPFLPPDAEAIDELRHSLDRARLLEGRTAGAELESALAPHADLYVRGLLACAAGDHAQAHTIANALDALPAPAAGMQVARALAQTVRGTAQWRAGHFAQAVRELEEVRGRIPSDLIQSPLFTHEYAHWVLAESLLQLGRDEDALRWYRYAFLGVPMEPLFMAPAALRIGTILDARGENAEAARWYGRALLLWDDADPDLRPLLQHAQERLRALTGG